MKVRNLKEYRYKRYTTITDEEANERKGYADEGIINAYIYPASGKIQAQIYGKELGYILNLITNEDILMVMSCISRIKRNKMNSLIDSDMHIKKGGGNAIVNN